MKYVKQFLIILAISFIGELLHYIIPLPIPASIYGMTILFILLLSGKLNLSKIEEVGKFLIDIMPIMFIPAGVGLITSWGSLKPVVIQVSIVTVITIFTVMGVTGRLSQSIIQNDKKKEIIHE